MSDHNDGGHAFPVHNGTGWTPGMTLRDYLAAKAMAAMMTGIDKWDEDILAATAYRMADAMLAARQA